MVSVDRNALISQIVSLNPQLKPDELRKLSDAQLQAKLSQTLAGDNDDFFIGLQIEHSNSVVNLKNYNKKTYTDNNENEITEYLDNDNNILERTTKSTDENGNVTERTVTYQNHKPIHTSLKKNGNTIEKSDLTYKTSDDGTDYVEISTIGADKSETVSYVLLTDDNGSIYNDVLFGKAKTKLDGTTVHVSRNKGTLLEQINKPNGKSVLNIYNGNDFQAYDDNDLNKLYQRTDMNGSVRDVLYDGNGNTYSTVNAGDSWAIIAQRYNVPENKLRALNKQKGELKPGQRILIPGEFNADSAPLKKTESPEVAKLKAENAERNRLFKIKQKQFEENFNNIIKNKTIPAANNLSSNITLGKKDKISIEDFVKNVLHLDTSKEVGKKVLFRLAQLPQEALNKISYTDFEQKQIGGMFAPKTNDFSNASFDDIANALLVRAGINVKYNQEIIADNIKQKAVQSQKNKLGINEQKFSQEMLANIYDNAANMLEQYYNNHGVFDAGTYMEATKNILDKILPDNILGQDFRGTLHIASDCRKIAQRIRNLHSENPMQFKKEFAQLKKDGIVSTEFNEQNIKEFMNLVQSGNVDINSDKFKKACQKAFGFNGLEQTEDYTKLWNTAGNVGDIANLLMTLGASAELKVMGKTTQATFNMLEKGAAKILSKSAAAKGAKLGTSMFMGGSSLAGYTLTKETLNNLSNPMRDAKDWDTWKQTGIASAESFGFGAFGGLLNETVVAPIVKAIEKPAAKATQAVTKAFAEQGELSGKEILQPALKGNEVNIDGFLGIFKLSSQEYATLARTATAKTVGFGTEVAGFTAYETTLATVKDIIDPKTGRLPEDMTLGNLTKHLKEQFANLGTIKSVSLFLMMSKGGKMAQKAMMTQMIASSEKLSDLKFKKAEINGQEFYEVTYPNGARKIVDTPEQAIALSQFALQMDMITATSEAKDTPQGMLDVEKQELITKASRENPANRVEEKVREEWQKTDLETSATDEKVDLFNLDTDAGLKTSTPEIKNETTSLILNGKLNENLTKRYDEMGRVFTEIAQRRSADIQKLADQYPNDKQKVADGIVKILSEEFGMQGYEPPIVLKDTQGADGGADWPNGRIIINKEITNLKQLTTMISHEYVHMLQFRDIVVQYGEQGVKDLINNDKSIPQDKKEQAINAALNNPYNKHLIASYNAQKAQSGSIDYYVRRIYKDEFTNTIGTDDMEGYTNQVAEREAYYGGSEHIGNNTTSLDQTNIGMAPADGAMAALRARMKAQLMKGKQTHNDVEVKTKKQKPSTQFEIAGDGQIHFKETPAGKLNEDKTIFTKLVETQNYDYALAKTKIDFTDFAKDGIPLEYSRNQFLKDLQKILDSNPEEKEQIMKEFNIKFNQTSFNSLGFELEDIPRIKIKKTYTEAEQKIINLIEKFTTGNKSTIANFETKSLLDSILQTFPEFALVVGKKQHNTHQYSLDIHTLKNLQDNLVNPKYKELDSESQLVLKYATILHDLGKTFIGDFKPDNGHEVLSAKYAEQILERFDLPQEIKNRIINQVLHHNWFEQYNNPNNSFSAQDVVNMFGSKEDVIIAEIMAKSDYANISENFHLNGRRNGYATNKISQGQFDYLMARKFAEINNLFKEKSNKNNESKSETPSENTLVSNDSFNLIKDKNLLENIKKGKVPKTRASENAIINAYKKIYAPKHNGIFESKVINEYTTKYTVKDKNGKILRECIYNKEDTSNNKDIFYQYNEMGNLELIIELNSDAKIKLIRQISADTEFVTETIIYDIKNENPNKQELQDVTSNSDTSIKNIKSRNANIIENQKDVSYKFTEEDKFTGIYVDPLTHKKLDLSCFIDSTGKVCVDIVKEDSQGKTTTEQKQMNWYYNNNTDNLQIIDLKSGEKRDISQGQEYLNYFIDLQNAVKSGKLREFNFNAYISEMMPIEKLALIAQTINLPKDQAQEHILTDYKSGSSPYQTHAIKKPDGEIILPQTNWGKRKALQKELDKHTIPYTIEVNRYEDWGYLNSITIKDSNLSFGERIRQLQQASDAEKNKFLTDVCMQQPLQRDDFMSTFLNSETTYFSHKPVKLCITLPKGTHGLYIEDLISKSGYESELLIQMKQAYRITNIQFIDEKPIIYMELIIKDITKGTK